VTLHPDLFPLAMLLHRTPVSSFFPHDDDPILEHLEALDDERWQQARYR
jgi:hypothetical protein